MSQDSLQEIYEMDSESRYDFTLSYVVEEREIWILINQENQFLKIFSEDEAFEYLPIWPSEQLAEAYAQGETDLEAMSISLPEFLNKWVPGLEKDQLELGVLPGNDSTVWVTDASAFKNDIQEELANL